MYEFDWIEGKLNCPCKTSWKAHLQPAASRQTQEMSSTVSKVGMHLTDDDVNNLAARHLEDSQLLEVQWDSTISVLRENQKREFKTFVEESFAGREVSTPVTPK